MVKTHIEITKERVAEAIETGFEYACNKEDGHFYSEDIADYVMQALDQTTPSGIIMYHQDCFDCMFYERKESAFSELFPFSDNTGKVTVCVCTADHCEHKNQT